MWASQTSGDCGMGLVCSQIDWEVHTLCELPDLPGEFTSVMVAVRLTHQFKK